MREIGYAVIVADTEQICGLCPVPLHYANQILTRYMAANPEKAYDIVPILVGSPVAPSVLPPIVPLRGDSTA